MVKANSVVDLLGTTNQTPTSHSAIIQFNAIQGTKEMEGNLSAKREKAKGKGGWF